MDRILMVLVLVFFALSGVTSAEAKGRVRPDNKVRTICPLHPCCQKECDCNVESSFDGLHDVERIVRREAKSRWRTCALKQVQKIEKLLSDLTLHCYQNPDTGYESAMTNIRDRCGGDTAIPARTRAEFQRSNRDDVRKCVRVRLGNGLWGLNCP